MCPAAAIDLGSNAVRMVVATSDSSGQLIPIENHREAIRLGAEVFSVGEISSESVSRLGLAFERFRGVLDRLRVRDVRAVATSAMREARNRDEVIAAIRARSNINVEIIPGEEEARLVYRAVAHHVPLRGKVALLIDIGGGSLEISVVANDVIVISESLTMGTVRLLQLLEERKRGAKIFARLVHEYVDGMRRQLKREIGTRTIGLCIGTGGNIDTVGELRERLLGKKGKASISRKELDALYQEIESLTPEERVTQLGLRPDRADVILPGVILLQHVIKYASVNEILIPHVGLKDGVLVELFEKRAGRGAADARKQVLTYAVEIGRRFLFEEAHGRKVAELAVQLFDDCKEIHRLDKDHRLLLELAALLHDVGQFINQNDHHKHSWYLLKSTPFVGLTEAQRHLVAVVARYHRKTLPKGDHEGFRDLSSDDKLLVRKLAAFVRIADALDCQQAGCVHRVAARKERDRVVLSVKASGDIPLERWSVARKSDLFEDIFKLQCVIED